MNLTIDLLEVFAGWLSHQALRYDPESDAYNTFRDASDALLDASDLLEEIANA